MKSALGKKHLLAAIFVFASGCNSDTAVRVDNNQLSAPIPAGIRQVAAFDNLPLELKVSVNGEVAREVPVSDSDEPVSVVVNLPADQNNDVDLGWFAIVGSAKVLLADFSTVITAGTSVLNVANYNSTGPRFDADSDGRTNLSEARDNRNLLSQFDLEVPFQTSFGGVFGDITSDGVDPDTSGEALDPDANSSFSLRHTDTDLVVYVCGQDQTLQGDNIASDGQYWHDDTVFIFIDGADSDNTSYDGVDDFQLAFVRETTEMIVSKGFNNQFCPAGQCVSHSFFSNSTSCEYELIVTLPLADMNMTVNTPIGFDIEITDDDNGGLREGSSAWIGFEDRSDLNPSTFGTITLNR